MSEFFNFESTSPKSKKKTFIEESSSEDEPKKSNQLKKQENLRSEIFSIDPKNSAQIEKFLKNIKKYKSVLKDGLPKYMLNFLNKCLEFSNKGLKTKINRVIETYQIENKFEEKIVKVESKSLDLIEEILKNDDMEGLNRLYENGDKKLKLKVCFVKLGILNRWINGGMRVDCDDFIDILDDVLRLLSDNNNIEIKEYLSKKECLKKDTENMSNKESLMDNSFDGNEDDYILKYKNQFKENINFYLKQIFKIIKPEYYPKFDNLLKNLEEFNFDIKLKTLEFKFYYKNEIEYNTDTNYKLLYFIRSNDYKSSKEYYLNLYHSITDLRILNELGNFALKCFDFKFSFDIFEYISQNISDDPLMGNKPGYDNKLLMANRLSYDNKINASTDNSFTCNNKLIIDSNEIFYKKLALCVILDSDIKNYDFFKNVFIVKVKKFDNEFLLKSVDLENEIIRAYYLFKRKRIREASNILHKYLNIDTYYLMRDSLFSVN